MRVHILGASGSGTTTLGRALAKRLGCPHHDNDDVYWLPSEPPYQRARPREARRALLRGPLSEASWTLSGSMCSWGDEFIPRFDLVVFLTVDRDVRLARLRQRELARFGAAALAPGGAMHVQSRAFMVWAARYDSADESIRSLRQHRAWLSRIEAPVLELDSTRSVGELVDAVMEHAGVIAERKRRRARARRIVIFGNAGSGKTTLAARLAATLGIDALELDEVRWQQRPDKPNPPERCQAIMDAFMSARSSWVIEGLHASLLQHVLAQATELHFLNPGFEVCRARALARPWNPRKSSSPESQLAIFHRYEPWFRSYDTRTDETSLSAHRTLFEAFQGRRHEHTGETVAIPGLR